MQEYIKKILGSGNTTLIISNDEIHDNIKIIKSLENSGLLIEGVTKTVQNEVREQKGGFLSILLGTLGASLLGNLLTGRGVVFLLYIFLVLDSLVLQRVKDEEYIEQEKVKVKE